MDITLVASDYVSQALFFGESFCKVFWFLLIKRTKGIVRNETITAGRISLNPFHYTVFVDDERSKRA